jgi:23S rRNA (uridine2552-2'-O)-methyltransferase
LSKRRRSSAWRERQERDPYVRQARQDGWRSRAVYKLEQIDRKEKLLRPDMRIVDLGAAPGGWSQYAARLTGRKGSVVAMDILPMEPLPGVEFVQGDFRDDPVLERLLALLHDREIDLVMSDIAPNISGMDAVDQPRAMYLAELAVDFADRVLRPGGDLLVKLFQGEGFDTLLKDLRGRYETVVMRKPRASRARSREVYALARGRKI